MSAERRNCWQKDLEDGAAEQELLPGSRGQKTFACHGHGQLNERSTVLGPPSSVRCPYLAVRSVQWLTRLFPLAIPRLILCGYLPSLLVSQIVQLHQQKVREKMLPLPVIVNVDVALHVAVDVLPNHTKSGYPLSPIPNPRPPTPFSLLPKSIVMSLSRDSLLLSFLFSSSSIGGI
ncbi:hypothetical protein KR059_004922 [Drosophila kikkawai]|nr:hypothetical protein KR059_004922 [Drosophila kikkawai]